MSTEEEEYNTALNVVYKPLADEPKVIDCEVGVKFANRIMCQCYWCGSLNDKDETYCAFENGFLMLCEKCHYCFRGFSTQEMRELIEKRRSKWKELDKSGEK